MRVRGKGQNPEATCVGKKAFLTYRDAMRIGRHSEAIRRSNTVPYKCPHCRLFHIGGHLPDRNVKAENRRIRERECME